MCYFFVFTNHMHIHVSFVSEGLDKYVDWTFSYVHGNLLIPIRKFWDLTGYKAALLPDLLSNTRTIRPCQYPILRLQGLEGYCDKTFCRLMNTGFGFSRYILCDVIFSPHRCHNSAHLQYYLVYEYEPMSLISVLYNIGICKCLYPIRKELPQARE